MRDFILGRRCMRRAGWKIIDFEGEPAKTMAKDVPPTASGATSPACCARSTMRRRACRAAQRNLGGRVPDRLPAAGGELDRCGCRHPARVRGRQSDLRGRLRDAEPARLGRHSAPRGGRAGCQRAPRRRRAGEPDQRTGVSTHVIRSERRSDWLGPHRFPRRA